MRRYATLGFLMVLVGLVAFDASIGEAMEIQSSAFKNGEKIPVQYVMPGAGGKNISIPLSWSGAPAGTKSFAISMIDHHPVANEWVHWLIVDIPAQTSSIPEGASGKKMPVGAIELMNSFGTVGYGGPQPPKGTGDHPYEITLYALSVERLNLKDSAGLRDFQEAIKGKVLATASLTGTYGR